ncbi:MAG: hypothetical protein HGA45_41080, partial [Chloroflexales bacterium]|nr:hypothetical protein [Chloroflexales bacterium]
MQTLLDLCAELAAQPAMGALAAALARRPAQLRVAPLPAAARTPVVAALARRHQA